MPYTKDTSTAQQFPVRYKRDYYGAALPSLDVNRKVLLRTRTGDRNPGWRDQIRAQQNATTSMSGVIDTIVATGGYVKIEYLHPFTGASVSNQFTGYLAVGLLQNQWDPSITSSIADRRAMQSYLKNVKATQKAFSGLTFLGELRETMRMIRRPGEGLRHLLDDYILDVKRRKAQAKKDATDRRLFGRKRREAEDVWKKDLSSMWLEHSFGWLPFINDLESAVNAYERARDRRLGSNQRPVSGYGADSRETPGKNLVEQGDVKSVGVYRRVYTGTERAEVKYRGMVKVDNTAIPIQNARLFGLSPSEFVPTAWELLPWSFLVDYFTNIGDVLENMTTDTSSLAWTNRSVIRSSLNGLQLTLDRKATTAAYGATNIQEVGSPKVQYLRRFVTRDVGTSTYVPPISFELPGRPAQWANMTALFAQASSIHPQRRRS